MPLAQMVAILNIKLQRLWFLLFFSKERCVFQQTVSLVGQHCKPCLDLLFFLSSAGARTQDLAQATAFVTELYPNSVLLSLDGSALSLKSLMCGPELGLTESGKFPSTAFPSTDFFLHCFLGPDSVLWYCNFFLQAYHTHGFACCQAKSSEAGGVTQ
jgi:hypothetical protein